MTLYEGFGVATGRAASVEPTGNLRTDGGAEPDDASTDDNGSPGDDGSTNDSDASDAADGEPEERATYAVLLDVMPQGLPGDDRPQYKKSPVAYGLGEEDFRLYQLTLTDEADVSVGSRVKIKPQADSDIVSRYREVELSDLTHNAEAEIEYAVEAIVEEHERRFVDFYNEAGPITLRLHQLNLLPGIGKKLRDDLLEERKRRGPFESFDDVEERISGLHRPREVIVERIMEELDGEDIKYRNFVGRDS